MTAVITIHTSKPGRTGLTALICLALLTACTPTGSTGTTASTNIGAPIIGTNEPPPTASNTEVPPPYALSFEPMPVSAPPQLVAEAAAITQRFVGTLLPTLQLAIASGGPVHAIEVCAVQAPQIAQQFSEDTGWNVRRVSLKTRNSSAATPDAWEVMALNMFDERQRGGQAGADINVAEIVGREFRYMQAQPAAPLCLTCHGNDIAPDVRSVLEQRYPDDMATGYFNGQIRGAITLRKDI
ncbi:MAG: DUF3365 domain-containing protein [Gammaproteobacteria bacterium]|nr:DUF3365 domain-containing protein [Gammaproteobacteria bacterium]MDP2347588.1 DUF3365 domain-containing protein [Gammaproteobacteria bacterium]